MANKTETVFILFCTNSEGRRHVASLYRTEAEAREKAERYNADKDPVYPETYDVERWGFCEDSIGAVVRDRNAAMFGA